MVGELFEYKTYLNGKTHVQKWVDRSTAFGRCIGVCSPASAVAPESTDKSKPDDSKRRERVTLLSGLVSGRCEWCVPSSSPAFYLHALLRPS